MDGDLASPDVPARPRQLQHVFTSGPPRWRQAGGGGAEGAAAPASAPPKRQRLDTDGPPPASDDWLQPDAGEPAAPPEYVNTYEVRARARQPRCGANSPRRST